MALTPSTGCDLRLQALSYILLMHRKKRGGAWPTLAFYKHAVSIWLVSSQEMCPCTTHFSAVSDRGGPSLPLFTEGLFRLHSAGVQGSVCRSSLTCTTEKALRRSRQQNHLNFVLNLAPSSGSCTQWPLDQTRSPPAGRWAWARSSGYFFLPGHRASPISQHHLLLPNSCSLMGTGTENDATGQSRWIQSPPRRRDDCSWGRNGIWVLFFTFIDLGG